MADTATAAAVQQVVSALNVLYQDPSPAAKEKANAWLQEFQKSDEAWSTAQLILFAPDAPIQPKLFAAQTFRTKITYDFHRLPPSHRLPLRDSLLTALRTFALGPRVILTQICISLADLALQLTPLEWSDPTTSMINLLGKEPQMAGALLEFLQVLAEEYYSNLKIEVANDFGRPGKIVKGVDGVEVMRSSGMADQVVGLLSMYVQAPGVTDALVNQSFACLGSWLKSGQAPASSLSGSAILSVAFSSLSNPALFDSAVDLLVDIIHETQEVHENAPLIQELLPHLFALGPAVKATKESGDEDQMRGLCRILVEAGECYTLLIVQHSETFLPLAEIILDCAQFEVLEVVGITLNFWYGLAKGVRKVREQESIRALLAVFAKLVGIIIVHLHYPDDHSTLVGQERDDFRNFRHHIGDTLKDCCGVLGALVCLRRSYDIISETLTSSSTSGIPPKWQDIEAPLFSMRSMATEVDPNDNEVMPLIMDIIPKLPSHPKIRYAAILVIGRYTQWIDYHPQYIQFQLPYVSAGFDDPDSEVSAAAAQSMRHLCKDCSVHLVPFLPQLHQFIQSVTSKLGNEDLLDLAAAIAHIIYVMPVEEAPQALATFCMPDVEFIHSITSSTTIATSAQLKLVCNALSRLDVYFSIIGSFSAPLPPSCQQTCGQVWSVLDLLLAKYGQNIKVAGKTCVVLRRGLEFFRAEEGLAIIAGAILERLTGCFEKNSRISSYLWITGSLVTGFAGRGEEAFLVKVKDAVERQSAKVFELLGTDTPDRISDVLDDYMHLLNDTIEYTPPVIFLSPLLPSSFQAILSSLTLLNPSIILTSLDALRAIIGHDSLQYDPTDPSSSSTRYADLYPHFETSIRATVKTYMFPLVAVLLECLIGQNSQMTGESTSTNVLTVFRLLSMQFGAELGEALPGVLEKVSGGRNSVGVKEKMEFMERFNQAMLAKNPNKVKEAFTWLMRASMKSQDRSRNLEIVAGGGGGGAE